MHITHDMNSIRKQLFILILMSIFIVMKRVAGLAKVALVALEAAGERPSAAALSSLEKALSVGPTPFNAQ